LTTIVFFFHKPVPVKVLRCFSNYWLVGVRLQTLFVNCIECKAAYKQTIVFYLLNLQVQLLNTPDATETLQFSKGNPYLKKAPAGITNKVTGG